MNNDLIRREDVFRELDSFLAEVEEKMSSILEQYGACANRATTNCEETARGAVNNIRKRINAIPAVEQPMSAVEYLYQRERMKADMGFPFCIPDKDKIMACVAVVEKWAQEHPERSEE